jgi:ribonuclease HI
MWQNKNNKLAQTFTFDSFQDALKFINQVGSLAERDNHHPTITNTFNRVTIELSTHDAGNTVTKKDYHLANQIDTLLGIISAPEIVSTEHPVVAKAKLYTDGGSRGNPGPSAGGYVILDMENNVVKSNGKYLGITTNNQAEYHSLKGGMEMAVHLGIRELDVFMDSLLVINQMKGVFKIKNRDLWPIHDAISKLVPKFTKVTFTHVPREFNKLADAVVNETLDAQR